MIFLCYYYVQWSAGAGSVSAMRLSRYTLTLMLTAYVYYVILVHTPCVTPKEKEYALLYGRWTGAYVVYVV